MNRIVLAATIVVLAAACSTGRDKAIADVAQAMTADSGAASNKVADAPEQQATSTPQENNSDWDKKIVKTAEIELELKDHDKYDRAA